MYFFMGLNMANEFDIITKYSMSIFWLTESATAGRVARTPHVRVIKLLGEGTAKL